MKKHILNIVVGIVSFFVYKYYGKAKMEVLKMRTVIKPFKMKKLNKRLTLLLKQSLDNAPVAPLEQLKQEAAEFEKMMLNRRNSVR